MINDYVADLLIEPNLQFSPTEALDKRELVARALSDCCTVLVIEGRPTPAPFPLQPGLTRSDVDTYDKDGNAGTWLLYEALDGGDLTLDQLEHDTAVIARLLRWMEADATVS